MELFVIGPPDGLHITVTPEDSCPWIAAVSSDAERQAEIDELVKRSGALAARDFGPDNDFGGDIWYLCRLDGEPQTLFGPMFQSHILHRLHAPRRILGWVRLGDRVLLNFLEDLPEGGLPAEQDLIGLNLPTPKVEVYLSVPGPIDGPFTGPVAHGLAEVVAAVCTFALGRPVNLPPSLWAAPDETIAELELDARRTDLSIPTLARNSIPLDVLFQLVGAGDMTSWQRLQGALISFDAALRQQREQVAVILCVVAAECLTNPFQPWKTERLTARFIKFFDELMPDHLDAIVQHGNFEQAFDLIRGSKLPTTLRRKMLSKLYSFRSEPVHEGLARAYEGFSFSGAAGQMRMLASWFAEEAILRYMQSPRSTLIGHPATATDEETEGTTSE